MTSRITFIIETDGVERDKAIADMSNEALEWSINAVCDAKGYSQESGVSKERYFSWMIRKWVELQVDRLAMKLSAEIAMSQAQAIKDSVVVPQVQE